MITSIVGKSRRIWDGLNPNRVNPDDLGEFEERISSHLFMDVPMGASLNDLLVIELLNAAEPWGMAYGLRHFARYIWATARLFNVRCPELPRSVIEENRGKILCTWISRRPQISGLILPVIRQLNRGSVLVIGNQQEMRDSVPSGVSFVAGGDIPNASFAAWFRSYVSVVPRWQREILDFFDRQGLSPWALPHMHRYLLSSAGRFAAYRSFLGSLRPSALLTEYDRNSFSVPLILAARSLGIKTFTLVHGMINSPFGYTPLVADKVFVWGERGKNTLMAYGVAAARIEAAGYPALNRFGSEGPPAAILEAAGLPPNQAVVLLATNPINHYSRRQFAQGFCEALHDREDLSLIVRLHPSEKLSFYEPLRSLFPRVRFFENSRWSLDESLAVADVVVCHNTGYALDAMVRRKPVVILDTILEPLLGTQDLIDEGGCPVAGNSGELVEIVDKILSDRHCRQKLIQRADRFVDSMYESFGDDAATRIAKIIQREVGRSAQSRRAVAKRDV